MVSKAAKDLDWRTHRSEERWVGPQFGEKPYRLALAYANTYFVGMSSLGFQRTFELVHQRESWGAERFFLDGEGMPRSVEKDTPLSNFAAIAFSVSFEGDYVHLLQMLRRAGLNLRREDRQGSDSLVIMGGSCASINPLPMADFVDVFALGAAENTLPALLESLEEGEKGAILERLAVTPGFFVPEYHRPEEGLANKLKKRELSADQMKEEGMLPTTAIVTANTEFSNKFLIEMSRGCPEKCRYCWATFGMGKFRYHPTATILESYERARSVTDQLGFVATAVGDHPEIELLLREALNLGFRTSVSSIRIPAVNEGVLKVLHDSGDRSITLAPETGSDRLRILMGKFVTNDALLEKAEMIFAAGFTGLKLYFIVGLPDEREEDIEAILDLARRIREIMKREARIKGVMGHLHLGVSALIPKPFTPWQREVMEDPKVIKKRLRSLAKGVAGLPNVTLGTLSVREAIWQTFLSRSGRAAASALESAATGASLGQLLKNHREEIQREVFQPPEGPLRWHFMGTG